MFVVSKYSYLLKHTGVTNLIQLTLLYKYNIFQKDTVLSLHTEVPVDVQVLLLGDLLAGLVLHHIDRLKSFCDSRIRTSSIRRWVATLVRDVSHGGPVKRILKPRTEVSTLAG